MSQYSLTMQFKQHNYSLFCPKLHTLIWEGNPQVLMRKNCCICQRVTTECGNHLVMCSICNYHLCASCESKQQSININSTNLFHLKCKQSHPLRQIRGDSIQRKACNVCKIPVTQNGDYALHCMFCKYEICEKCEYETQLPNSKSLKFERIQKEMTNDKVSLFPCPRYHPLYRLTDASVELKVCSICRRRVSDSGNSCLNCAPCGFDVCVRCEQARMARCL